MTTTLAETDRPRLVPPYPEPPSEDLSGFQLVAAFRSNGLCAWPRRAYESDVLERRFFGRTSLLLNAPDAIRRVLVDNHENYGRTPATVRILRPLLGRGLFLSDGPAWRHQRRTLSPAFTPRAVETLVPHILSATHETVTELEGARGPVDLLTAVQRLALEIAGRTMFSVEMRGRGAALRDLIARYGLGLARPRLLDFVLPIGIPSPHDLARMRFRRNWTAFFDEVMAERRRNGVPGPARDLFDLLLAARDPETGRAFSPEELRDQVATMIVAGHETTAVALFWSLHLLALAPDVQEEVAREAADTRIEDGSALQNFTLARAVLDEAMRLYPPAYAVARMARGPDTVSGVQVRRGDLIVIAPWVLHRHRRLWQDPDAFRPERFLPGARPMDRFAYLPFGAGPRVCIGAHFALTEATLVLASLVRAFRISLAGTRPVRPVAIVTTQPDHPPPFRLERRRFPARIIPGR